MAFVEGTGGPVNGTGWKNQNKTQGSASTGGSGSGSGASYDLSWLQNLYAQQQAAAAAAEQARRAAAQQAYERSMAALNAAYNGQIEALKNNYNSTLGQLRSDYEHGAAGVNFNADNALQQAYINQMMTLKSLPQQLAAQGIGGGAAAIWSCQRRAQVSASMVRPPSESSISQRAPAKRAYPVREKASHSCPASCIRPAASVKRSSSSHMVSQAQSYSIYPRRPAARLSNRSILFFQFWNCCLEGGSAASRI